MMTKKAAIVSSLVDQNSDAFPTWLSLELPDERVVAEVLFSECSSEHADCHHSIHGTNNSTNADRNQ